MSLSVNIDSRQTRLVKDALCVVELWMVLSTAKSHKQPHEIHTKTIGSSAIEITAVDIDVERHEGPTKQLSTIKLAALICNLATV